MLIKKQFLKNIIKKILNFFQKNVFKEIIKKNYSKNVLKNFHKIIFKKFKIKKKNI